MNKELISTREPVVEQIGLFPGTMNSQIVVVMIVTIQTGEVDQLIGTGTVQGF